MRTLSIVAVTGIAVVLAACEQAPVSTPMAEPEPHPIEGMWQMVEATVYRHDTGEAETLNYRNLTTPATMTLDDGTYESRSSNLHTPSASDQSDSGTYIVIEETRTLVITAQGSEPGSIPWTRMYSYGMNGPDKLDLLDRYHPSGTITYHMERMSPS